MGILAHKRVFVFVASGFVMSMSPTILKAEDRAVQVVEPTLTNTPPAETANGSGPAAADPQENSRPGPIRITVARASRLVGNRVYEGRETTGGTGVQVTFSRTPIYSAAVRGGPSLGMPLPGARISSGFGMRRHPISGASAFHTGVDLVAPVGTPVYATSDGAVGRAEWAGGYGLLVELEHGGGLQTRYGHLSSIAVAPGQAVKEGDLLGYVGSTGNSTGPHLHYETRLNGRAYRPMR